MSSSQAAITQTYSVLTNDLNTSSKAKMTSHSSHSIFVNCNTATVDYSNTFAYMYIMNNIYLKPALTYLTMYRQFLRLKTAFISLQNLPVAVKSKTQDWLGNRSKNGLIKLQICSPSGCGKSFHSRGLTSALITRTSMHVSPLAPLCQVQVNKIQYAASWSCSQEKNDSDSEGLEPMTWQMPYHAQTGNWATNPYRKN